jgi:hypothetical protein
MSETIDLTLLSSRLQGVEREVRLMGMQLDLLAGAIPPRLAAIEARITGTDGRIGVLEQSLHSLTAEVAQGFGQMQQQMARAEQRFDAVQTGLAELAALLKAMRPTP